MYVSVPDEGDCDLEVDVEVEIFLRNFGHFFSFFFVFPLLLDQVNLGWPPSPCMKITLMMIVSHFNFQ